MSKPEKDTEDYTAILFYSKGEAYDGQGWYYYDAELPEEGSVGAFKTRSEATRHARAGDYTKFEYIEEDKLKTQKGEER